MNVHRKNKEKPKTDVRISVTCTEVQAEVELWSSSTCCHWGLSNARLWADRHSLLWAILTYVKFWELQLFQNSKKATFSYFFHISKNLYCETELLCSLSSRWAEEDPWPLSRSHTDQSYFPASGKLLPDQKTSAYHAVKSITGHFQLSSHISPRPSVMSPFWCFQQNTEHRSFKTPSSDGQVISRRGIPHFPKEKNDFRVYFCCLCLIIQGALLQ